MKPHSQPRTPRQRPEPLQPSQRAVYAAHAPRATSHESQITNHESRPRTPAPQPTNPALLRAPNPHISNQRPADWKRPQLTENKQWPPFLIASHSPSSATRRTPGRVRDSLLTNHY